jgi:hypothetical protein
MREITILSPAGDRQKIDELTVLFENTKPRRDSQVFFQIYAKSEGRGKVQPLLCL